MVIAIDGPAGSGKSSTAKLVALRLGILHLDTGAMYRAITLKCLREKIPYTDIDALSRLLKRTTISFAGSVGERFLIMDGEDVSVAIRSDEVTKNVSDYCAPKVVRDAMVELQRCIGSETSCVCEGRDIGTVVFPRAEFKFYLVASVSERARRRQIDFQKLGIYKTLEELEKEIEERDYKDSTRLVAPLKKAPDAYEIDTTNLTLQQQVQIIVDRVQAQIKA